MQDSTSTAAQTGNGKNNDSIESMPVLTSGKTTIRLITSNKTVTGYFTWFVNGSGGLGSSRLDLIWKYDGCRTPLRLTAGCTVEGARDNCYHVLLNNMVATSDRYVVSKQEFTPCKDNLQATENPGLSCLSLPLKSQRVSRQVVMRTRRSSVSF